LKTKILLLAIMLLLPKAAIACPTCWQDQSAGVLVAVGAMAFLPMIIGFSIWWILSRQLKNGTNPQEEAR